MPLESDNMLLRPTTEVSFFPGHPNFRWGAMAWKFLLGEHMPHNHTQYMREWRRKNPEKERRSQILYKLKRKDRIKQSLNRIYFGGHREEVFKRDNYQCVKCGMTDKEHHKKWDREITIDHIDGRGLHSNDKNNSLDNLQTLCSSCHGFKDNQNRKLSEEIVLEIRALYESGKYNYKKLGEMFNVHRFTIGKAITKITWKHI